LFDLLSFKVRVEHEIVLFPFDFAQGTNHVCRWLSEVEATLTKCFRSKSCNAFFISSLWFNISLIYSLCIVITFSDTDETTNQPTGLLADLLFLLIMLVFKLTGAVANNPSLFNWVLARFKNRNVGSFIE
jgi:hypothetical protein